MTETSSATTRIAVLIDCDNVSPTHAGAVLEELATYGTPTIKRAYGDWTTNQLSGWKNELNRLAIQPTQQFSYTVGKNSTDSALIIDAMDLLWMGNVEAFAIVSSDSDFTRLATRLRESGKRVIGLGERKTPESLRNAVDQFIYLELLGGTPEEDSAPSRRATRRGRRGGAANDNDTDAADGTADVPVAVDTPDAPDALDDDRVRINLESALAKAINATSGDDGWASLSRVGQHLSRTHVDFDPRDFGHQKLSTLVSEQPYLEHRTADSRMQVRLKQGRNRM
ncbi:NYN domain-containing protein [Citricoccus sp. K5]|uniref:NYN domain-containing protein n=1 Tax=Citricoccus sp. K5 TaxID=2653135 RepID=UPI0013584142|nr:NYN domain-containing protein [Citricoccus sp. K5]